MKIKGIVSNYKCPVCKKELEISCYDQMIRTACFDHYKIKGNWYICYNDDCIGNYKLKKLPAHIQKVA